MADTLEAPAKPRLRARYDDENKARLKEQLGLSNPMEVPRLSKIVVNCGVGEATLPATACALAADAASKPASSDPTNVRLLSIGCAATHGCATR